MERKKIIGRQKELDLLQTAFNSDKSEFVAIYGRRRVGKTYLIRTAFEDKFSFQISGLANTATDLQLFNFYVALKNLDKSDTLIRPENWLMAFYQLGQYLEKLDTPKKVVFIDELPWFDGPNAGFIQALEHFWNSWASARRDVVLVVCGSAASWIINKLINNKGGLHNRVTKRIKVLPFNLKECEAFMLSKNAAFTRYQIAELYMVFGGIPFYWDEVQANLSTTQNIQAICFEEGSLLRTEFINLFSSLFAQSERHESIVYAIAQKTKGLTRGEIIALTGLPNSGRTTQILDELEESGFIIKYTPFEKKTRSSLYQLVDFYSLFYLKFIKNMGKFEENTWVSSLDNPSRRAWSGYAFEQICLAHLPQIRKALGISGIQTSASSWRSSTLENGTQIDIVIDRRDQVINLCEMKFSINPFIIDKKYDLVLRNKIAAFKAETKTRKSVYLTLITTFGLQKNQYALGLVQNDLNLDCLFE
jgi:uncharacterized protein